MQRDAAGPEREPTAEKAVGFALAVIAAPDEMLTADGIGALHRSAQRLGARSLTVVAHCASLPECPADLTLLEPNMGRQTVVEAIKQALKGSDPAETVDAMEQMLGEVIAARFGPAPDLILMTGGLRSLSGAFTWQAAYSEFVFLETRCAELTEAQLAEALRAFLARERRFGGLGPDSA